MPFLVFQSILRFLFILIIEIVAFFFFYNHPVGRHAVYYTWYAGIIDVLAIISGAVIMGVSIYALHTPSLFTISIPSWVFWLVFLVGSWQAAIHGVKMLIRLHKP